jgi:hypothetical protein
MQDLVSSGDKSICGQQTNARKPQSNQSYRAASGSNLHSEILQTSTLFGHWLAAPPIPENIDIEALIALAIFW